MVPALATMCQSQGGQGATATATKAGTTVGEEVVEVAAGVSQRHMVRLFGAVCCSGTNSQE